MHTLLDQIESSLDSRHYFLSLYTTLTVPDIAGALGSDDGQATGKKYIAWFEQWARPRFSEMTLAALPADHRKYVGNLENPLTGEGCYLFRCSLLHQGRTQHPKGPFSRIIFIEPGATKAVVHYTVMNDALCIDLNLFCREVIEGARLWLDQAKGEINYLRNYEQFARRHAHGLAPFIGGVPVIS